eukprot:46432-Eustigmatos_ZCMA.PRE.1
MAPGSDSSLSRPLLISGCSPACSENCAWSDQYWAVTRARGGCFLPPRPRFCLIERRTYASISH